MSTKRQQTMAKLTRERAVKEKRERKLERKRERKLAAAGEGEQTVVEPVDADLHPTESGDGSE